MKELQEIIKIYEAASQQNKKSALDIEYNIGQLSTTY